MADHLDMNTPPIVSLQEWEAARQELLVEEKGLTRARDALAARRRRMPWLAVEKEYRFEGPDGPASLPTCSRAPPADRLPLLLRAGRHDVRGGRRVVPGAGLRGLLLRSPTRSRTPPT